MAEGKKSFIAYSDWYGTFKALPDDIAGQLIKYIFSYVNDEEPQPHENYIVNALFEQVKATLKRDLNKWDKQREQRSEAGKKSAELRATKSNERSTVVNEKVRNPTVSVNVNDNVNDNVSTDVDVEKAVDTIFLEYREKYKFYANQLFIDTIFMESICKEFLKTDNEEIRKLTLKKYLGLFLNSLDQSKKIHNNKKDFQQHFPSWLRKQPSIVKVYPKQEEIRYF